MLQPPALSGMFDIKPSFDAAVAYVESRSGSIQLQFVAAGTFLLYVLLSAACVGINIILIRLFFDGFKEPDSCTIDNVCFCKAAVFVHIVGEVFGRITIGQIKAYAAKILNSGKLVHI